MTAMVAGMSRAASRRLFSRSASSRTGLPLRRKVSGAPCSPATRPRSGRAWGWRKALLEAGATVPPIVQASYSPTSGYDSAQKLTSDPSITALLCGNDELAIGAARAFQENGRRVPEDVSIVGFDDQPFARMWMPALTTVRQDFVDLGRRTFALLEEWLARVQPAVTRVRKGFLTVLYRAVHDREARQLLLFSEHVDDPRFGTDLLDASLTLEEVCGLGLIVAHSVARLHEVGLAHNNVEPRSLSGWKTAYPRVSKLGTDPDNGLASIEALYLAYHILGRPTEGLLDHYRWAAEFLAANGLSNEG